MRLFETTHMKNFALALVSALAFALTGCGSPSDTGADPVPAPGPGPAPAIQPAVAYNFYEPKSEADLIADTNYGYLVAKVGQRFDTTAFNKLGLKVLGAFSANGGTYYHLYKSNDVLETLNRAKGTPNLLYIEPEPMTYMCADLAPGAYGNPGDPRVSSELWGVHTTKTIDAWKTYGFGPNKAYVANVDTGVRFAHEDMAGQVVNAFSWFQPNGETPLSGIYIPGPYTTNNDPVDYMSVDGSTGTDGQNHGTVTCGIMSAVGNNGKGAAGVCWGPKLISYKGLGNSGGGGLWTTYGSIWHLVKWKKENGHTGTIPVNYSMTSNAASMFASDMIEYGLQNGVMVIAASGNSGQRVHAFPAAYTGAMAVGATNGSDARWGASNYGSHLSVMAPGMNIVAPGRVSDSAYINISGTSMAAPFVTGLAGYMLTFNPDLKPDQIRTYIEQNTDYIGGATGYTEECGWGRINVLKTIQAVKSDYDAHRTPPSNFAAGIKVQVSVTLENGETLPFAFQSGLYVYLYQCNETGTIANYVACTVAGDSWTDWNQAYDPIEPGLGVAYFPMLRPGLYIAKAFLNVQDPAVPTAPQNVAELISTPVIEVAPGQTQVQEAALAFKKIKIMFIQTYPTSDPVRGNTADTIITMYKYNPASFFLPWESMWHSGDQVQYDQLNILPMPTVPGTYYLKISGFTGMHEDEFVDGRGEYALYMTNNLLNYQQPPAPGTYTAALGTPQEGSKSQERGEASQLIELDKVYYGSIETRSLVDPNDMYKGDWYKFVVK